MRDDQRNYIFVGVFVIAMLAGLLLWIALLSGRTGATDGYFIRYGNVLGLSEGTQIYFDVPLEDHTEQDFRLDVSIRRGWKIPTDSVANITASGLLSAVVINITGGQAETFLEPGDQIPSKEPTNLMAVMSEAASGFNEFLLDTLKPQLTGIVEDLNGTMGQVKQLLSSENTARVSSILANLESVSQDVEGIAGGLGGTTSQVDQVLARLDQVVAQISELIAENEEELSQSIVDLHESLEAVARHADAISSNLEVTTRNMDEFSQQIREDPGVLLFGREGAQEPAGSQ